MNLLLLSSIFHSTSSHSNSSTIYGTPQPNNYSPSFPLCSGRPYFAPYWLIQSWYYGSSKKPLEALWYTGNHLGNRWSLYFQIHSSGKWFDWGHLESALDYLWAVLLLNHFIPRMPPQDVTLQTFDIWFNFEDLPYTYWSEGEILELLQNIAPVAEIFPNFGFPTSSIGYRIRTTINAANPLPFGVDIIDEFGSLKLTQFNYEKPLPLFYFYYWVLVVAK